MTRRVKAGRAVLVGGKWVHMESERARRQQGCGGREREREIEELGGCRICFFYMPRVIEPYTNLPRRLYNKCPPLKMIYKDKPFKRCVSVN